MNFLAMETKETRARSHSDTKIALQIEKRKETYVEGSLFPILSAISIII